VLATWCSIASGSLMALWRPSCAPASAAAPRWRSPSPAAASWQPDGPQGRVPILGSGGVAAARGKLNHARIMHQNFASEKPNHINGLGLIRIF
jgi:hypothetical protein